jgi:hypothetical protein
MELSFNIDGTIKIFHDKQILKQYITTKSPLQILQGILHTEDESKQNHYRKYQTMGEEKTNNQKVALIQLHTFKSLNNKNN